MTILAFILCLVSTPAMACMFDTDCQPVGHLGNKPKLGSYSLMSSKVHYYRTRAKECCLKAVRAEDNTRRIHWLEAAARWLAVGRQEGEMLTSQNAAD
jgi:hypothetical protein